MSDYSIVNLREVEDSARQFGMPEGMEARFSKRALGSTIGAVSLQRYGPGLRAPFGHRHTRQEETYVILEGGGTINIDGEIVELGRWDAVRVPPGSMRAFEAGPDGLEILAFGAPIAEEPDIEMAPGWWGD